MAKNEATVVLSLLLVMITLSSFTVVDGYGTMVGGRTPINNVKSNKEVQELGRFAVKEYNMSQGRKGSAGSELVFSQVVEAQQQVVAGIKYYLTIEATQNGLTKMFQSVVVVKPWAQSKELLNFSPTTQ